LEKGLSLIFAAGMLACTVASSSQASEPAEGWKGKAFSATQYEYEVEQPERKTVNNIFISSLGLRSVNVENPQSGIKDIISIFNFKTEMTWLLDPKLKSYVILEGGKEDENGEYAGGIFNNKPCQGFSEAKKTESARIGGRDTEKWLCADKTKPVKAIQYFDPKLRTVIREDSNGHVSELRKIKVGKQDVRLFQQPPGYKKVSMEEMLLGYAKLPAYQESKPAKGK
jgi:hypothetical protein